MDSIDYDEAVKAVGEAFAKRDADHQPTQPGAGTPTTTHYNDARRVLWPLLDESAQSRRVLR